MASRKEPAKIRGVYEREPGTGIWWICYKQGSIRKREKVGRRGDAVALYHHRKTEMRAGTKLAHNLRVRGATFSTLAADALKWSAEHHPKDIRTLTGRMATLTKAFGTMTASELTPQAIEIWLMEHTAWAPATKNRYRAALSLAYRQGMRNGKVAGNPARLVAARAENNGKIRYLTDAEEVSLREAMTGRYDHHLPALTIAVHTGMRLSEQYSLTWDAVDLDRREITLTATKNGSTRTIPLNSLCIAAFEELAKVRSQTDDRVFRSARGEAVDRPRAWFKVILDATQIKGLRWHDLRHTFCSRLSMAGVDIRTIAALAGHKTLQMAMRYSHLAPSHNLSAVERLTQAR